MTKHWFADIHGISVIRPQDFANFFAGVSQNEDLFQKSQCISKCLSQWCRARIYLDYKFQWPQEGLNCESLA